MSKSNIFDCSSGCRSLQHGALITAAIIRGTEAQAIAYMKNLCQRCHLVTDSSGKTALHTAASCGKRKVVRWLLLQGIALSQKDTESGYTPLHRAIFYGHVHIAVDLIKAGANLTAFDFEALTPLDHINFDRPSIAVFTFSLPRHVYVWGSNSNFNLGQAHQNARVSPEWVEFLHREGQVIADVALNKFHTLFLASSGRVYACGIGQGGRLGLDITSPIVTPRPVKGLLQYSIIKIATGPDHSMFLTDVGQVWTCGNNSYHQLGLNPPPEEVYSPRPVSWHKQNKEESIKGIGAGRYHSVMWSSSVLYTFGLNGGQLGHFRNDKERTIVTPRRVTSIVLKDGGTLSCVGVSDGATVVSTSFGDIYVLHQYQTRKVASRMLGIIKIACVGGQLDSKVGADGVTEKGGASLKIAVLVGGGIGHLYLWTEETMHLSRCLFTINRQINLVDFSLNVNSLLIVSDEGEAFSAHALPPRERKSTDKVLGKPWGPSGKFNEFVDRGSSILVRLTRIAALHRTVAIMCDPKGRNFAALQNDPSSFLLDVPQVIPSTMGDDLGRLLLETNEEDSIHDVIIQCGGSKFPAHSYVLAYHSGYFREMLLEKGEVAEDSNANVQKVCSSLQDSDKKCLMVSGIKPEILQEVLSYIYSGSCQLTRLGQCKFKLCPEVEDVDNCGTIHTSYMTNDGFQYSNNQLQSAHTVYSEEKAATKNSNKKKRKGQKNVENKHASSSRRPLEHVNMKSQKKPLPLLHAAAKKLEVTSLVQEVESLEMVDGCIQLKYGCRQRDLGININPSYSRDMYQDLCDVMIQSKSGELLGAHKCMLASRLEYFNCMFSASWIEAMSSKPLNMPIPTGILAIILDFLYEDDSAKLHQIRDVEFLCNVLVVVDQFLISRLKEICEVLIAGLLTLKNAGEILEFSSNYNADQLKNTTMQFISLNLAAILENGSLLSVSSDILADLSKYYRQFIPRMACRHLTPFNHPPYAEELEQVLEEKPLVLPDSEEEWDDVSVGKGEKQQNSSRKKKRSRRNSQGEPRSRKTSTSSQLSVSSGDCDAIKDLDEEFETLNFDDLEERNPNENLLTEDRNESKSSSLEIMPLKRNIEIKSENKQISLPNSWQTVGKKRITSGQLSTTPTETSMESPTKDDFVWPVTVGTPLEDSSLKLDKLTPNSKTPVGSSENQTVGSYESAVTSFPSLSDSFSRATKGTPQNKNAGSSKINKLSQKQRKKQAAEAAAAADSEEAAKTSKISTPTSCWGSSTPAWGSSSKTSSVTDGQRKSQTLADIIRAEEASVKARQTSAPINIQIGKKCSSAGTFTPTKKGWSTSDSLPDHRGIKENDGGAWGATNATSPISSPSNASFPSGKSPFHPQQEPITPSFSKILHEEEVHMGNLLRERCKPLSFIQLEDRAIEELYAFYGANKCFEEKIKVTRVRTAMANPTWKKS